MGRADFVDPYLQRAASAPGRTWEVAFYLLLSAYSAALLLEVVTYPADARLVPLITLVILLSLLVVRIVTLVLGDRLPIRVAGFFDDVASEFTTEDEFPVEDSVRYRREIEMLVWLSALLATIWLLGFVISIVTFTPLFTYAYTRSVRFAVVTTATITAFVYGMFVVVLSSRLWTGVLL